MKRLSVVAGIMATGAWWVLAGSAYAQVANTKSDQTAAELELEEITVTASRIAREGFLAPTPTLVLQPEQLRQGGRMDLFSALNDLPQFNNIWTPASLTDDTTAGTHVIDLRGLGTTRTLTLINGRRPANSNESSFNLAFIPFTLVERVEVVTGGASAAWGSGAVAGVVNVILNDKLEGLHLNGQYGISSRGDGDQFTLGGALGTSFADGRGHFMIGAEYVDDNGIYSKNARPWGRGRLTSILETDPNEFTVEWHEDANFTYQTPGGVIGPTANVALRGIEFGPGGVPRPFQYGSPRNNFYMIGGGGFLPGDFQYLTAPITRGNAYARGTYELLPSLTLSADVLYARSQTDFPTSPQTGDWFFNTNFVINRDNAFLPESIRQTMIANNLNSFRLGRMSTEEGLVYFYKNINETIQGNIGLQGDLGGGFSWDAYVGYGRTTIHQEYGNQRYFGRQEEALDSILVDGVPVCRSLNPACAPFNPFGVGSPSAASIAYFTGTSFKDTVVKQHIAAATVRGEPFSTWAGPVSVAAGVEWRRNSITADADDISEFIAPYDILNFSSLAGKFSVKEAFGEVVVPLAKDMPLLQLLELNGAIRVSDYSRSGTFTSWKIGASYEPIDGLRFRATRSRDQRAPDLCDLFCKQSVFSDTVTDPFNSNRIDPVTIITGGNPDLGVEAADTYTFGVTLRPALIPGLSLSVDYYDIEIKDVISGIFHQDVVDQCFQGNAALCEGVIRNPEGRITEIRSQAVNLAKFMTNGIDAELVYTTSLSGLSMPGDITLRGNLGWVDEVLYEDPTTTPRDLVGFFQPFDGVPKWRATGSVRYQGSRLGVDLRARHINGGKYYDYSRTGQRIADNHVEARTYFDLGLDYQLVTGDEADDRVELFATVSNLFDKRPPRPFSRRQHDVVGRYFTTGVRMKF